MDLAHYFQESTQHIEDKPQVTSGFHAVVAPCAYPAWHARRLAHLQM